MALVKITKTNTSGIEWTYQCDKVEVALNRADHSEIDKQVNDGLDADPTARIKVLSLDNVQIGGYPRPRA